jgi:hypothetical protein
MTTTVWLEAKYGTWHMSLESENPALNIPATDTGITMIYNEKSILRLMRAEGFSEDKFDIRFRYETRRGTQG